MKVTFVIILLVSLLIAYLFILRTIAKIFGLTIAVIFIILTLMAIRSFLSDNSKLIYENGKRIGNSCYKIYKGKVYSTFKSEAEFIIYSVKELYVDPNKFKIYKFTDCAGHDDKNVYIVNFKIPNSDPATFRLLKKIPFYTIFADKNRIYTVKYYPDGVLYATYISVINEPPDSVILKGKSGYIISKKYVYYHGKKLDGLNPLYTKFPTWIKTANNKTEYTGVPIAYDDKSNLIYCGTKKINININNLHLYKADYGNNFILYYAGNNNIVYNELCELIPLQKIKEEANTLIKIY